MKHKIKGKFRTYTKLYEDQKFCYGNVTNIVYLVKSKIIAWEI